MPWPPPRWTTIIGTCPPPYTVLPARSPPLPVVGLTGGLGKFGESQQPLVSLGPKGASSAKLPSSQVTKIAVEFHSELCMIALTIEDTKFWAGCVGCGGVLKPDVVFFGENVPRPRAEACYTMVERSGALVVLGSSLTVMSGFRYVRHAAGLQRPVVIVNQGATRGDGYATVTLDAPLGRTLTELVAALGSPR